MQPKVHPGQAGHEEASHEVAVDMLQPSTSYDHGAVACRRRSSSRPPPDPPKPAEHRDGLESTSDTQSNPDYVPPASSNPSPSLQTPLIHPPANARHTHAPNWKRNPNVLSALWLTVFVASYMYYRALSCGGLPADGVTDFDPVDAFDDVTKILMMGFCLLYLTGLLEWDRTKRILFTRAHKYFPLSLSLFLFLILGTIFAAFSNLPTLQHSLADVDQWGPEMIICMPIVLSALVFFIAVIAIRAWRARPDRVDRVTFFGLRLGLLVLFLVGGWALYAAGQSTTPHLHHFLVAYYGAIWADGAGGVLADLLLMGCASVWLQGLGAYSYANYVSPRYTLKPITSSRSSVCLASDAPARGYSCRFVARETNISARLCFAAANATVSLRENFAFDCDYLSRQQADDFFTLLNTTRQLNSTVGSGAGAASPPPRPAATGPNVPNVNESDGGSGAIGTAAHWSPPPPDDTAHAHPDGDSDILATAEVL